MQEDKKLRSEIEINVSELVKTIVSKIPLIILSAVILSLIIALFSFLFITPTYTTTTKMFIMPEQDSNRVTMSSQLQAGSMLSNDYMEIIKSNEVADTVISKLHLVSSNGTAIKSGVLLSKVSTSIASEGRIIAITVTDSDPYLAADIANAVYTAAADQINDVAGATTVSLVDTAEVPSSRTAPNITRSAMIGAIVGAFIAVVIVIITYLINDSINTSDDVERYLSLSTLGIIPRSSHLGGEIARRHKSKK